MTLAEIMYLMNEMIDEGYELEGGKIPDNLLRIFNACSKEIQKVARLHKRATTLYIPGKDEYGLPKDLYTLIPENSVWLEDKPLKELSLKVNRGTGFFRWGNQLLLNNLPDKEATLTIYYYSLIPTFTGDPLEEPCIASPFHDIYAKYAAKVHTQGLWNELEAKQDFDSEYMMRLYEFEIYSMTHDTAPLVRVREG